MKYPRARRTENEGVLFVEDVVNKHGSIFRRVHQETDLGIDGFIEILTTKGTTGHLIAVQIKSGESYVDKKNKCFNVRVDNRHLKYWTDFMVPVILIGYSPSKKTAAWTSIRDYVARETYEDRLPLKSIRIPFESEFNAATFASRVKSLAHVRADERILLKCANGCLDDDPQKRFDSLQILMEHPDSRDLNIVFHLAKELLLDSSRKAAREALRCLGYGVGRQLWSFDPGNKRESDVISRANSICQTLSPHQIRRCLELMDDDAFGGPFVLGTYCYLVLQACWSTSESVLWDIMQNLNEPLCRRLNAFWIHYDCEANDMMCETEERDYFLNDPILAPLYRYWFEEILKDCED